MISDKSLMVVSLAVAAAGLVFLFLITISIEPMQAKISEVSSDLVGRDIVVKGKIDSYFTKEGNVFITLKEGAKIKVVMFSREAQKQPWVYDLQKGDSVFVEGRVQLYKNELEIVANTIKVFNFS